MTPQAIGIRRVQNFLKNSLPGRLRRDLLYLRMIKEADLECCVYHYLRRFLRRDPTWKLFARKHSLHTGHYIDLILFRKGYPRIAIELKWNRARMSRKDRHSLRRSLRSLRVNKAYFVTTLIGARLYKKIRKTVIEKNRLFEIVIPLPLQGAQLKNWKQERRAFTSRMVRGRAGRKARPNTIAKEIVAGR